MTLVDGQVTGRKLTAENKKLRYAKTFEWFVSELLIREFGARASGFSIRLRDANPDDEFDCVAILDGGIVFVECKTGKGALYPEIRKFSRRDAELCATYSIFVFDRDYTFHPDSDMPRLTQRQASDIGVTGISKIVTLDGRHSFFEVYSESRMFHVSTGFDDPGSRIRHILRYSNLLAEGGPFVGGKRHDQAYMRTPVPFDSAPSDT